MKQALSAAAAIESNGHWCALAPGAVLENRYRIVRQLGKGGMGAVYEAVDLRLDATVALKEAFSVDDRLRRQFEQEARLLAHLHHPALPRVSDYFTEGERAFLVMQFISGNDLAEIIAQQPGPFPRNQVIAWADQLLDALVYLHTRDRQIIHRDIKPHNLKLTSNGQIALLDFGLAKTNSADVSTTHSSASIFGYTRRYSPLEQIEDQGTTPQSDIYALGATLYHLLTGVKPPDALARAAALRNSESDPLRPANEIHGAVGREIASILSHAMALNREDRYQSANDFREALRQVGRKETRLTNKSEGHFLAEAVRDSNMSAPVIRRASVAPVDPFDSYSILKPDEPAWLVPKPSRTPIWIVALLAVIVAASSVLFYDYPEWIETWVSGSPYSTTTSDKEVTASTLVHQDKSGVNAPGNASVHAASVSEASRKNERPGRRVIQGSHATGQRLKR